MENCAQGDRNAILLLIIFEKEIADGVRFHLAKFIVDKRFGKYRLPATWVGGDPQ